MTVDQMTVLFLARCRAERLSENTVSFYKKYLQYLQEVHGEKVAEKVSLYDLRELLAVHQAKGLLSPTTINHLVASWRAAFTWAYKEELIDLNPTARLKKIKAPIRVPEVISAETIKAILAALPADFKGLRDKTMLFILLDAGLRLSELMDLQLEDVDIARGTLTVIGKGDKQRQVPISPATCAQIVKYLGHRSKKVSKHMTALWISDRGGRVLNEWYLGHMLRALCKDNNLPHVHPHLFRHTCATELLRAGANPMHVQLLLGHTSVTTTQLYVHLAGADVTAMHEQASPVSRMLQNRSTRRNSSRRG
jgi:integrase/recombinase XerC